MLLTYRIQVRIPSASGDEDDVDYLAKCDEFESAVQALDGVISVDLEDESDES